MPDPRRLAAGSLDPVKGMCYLQPNVRRDDQRRTAMFPAPAAAAVPLDAAGSLEDEDEAESGIEDADAEGMVEAETTETTEETEAGAEAYM